MQQGRYIQHIQGHLQQGVPILGQTAVDVGGQFAQCYPTYRGKSDDEHAQFRHARCAARSAKHVQDRTSLEL